MGMEQWLFEHEIQLRLGCFFTILLTMAGLEYIMPRRPLLLSRKERWPHNIGLVVLNSLLLRLVFPFAAVGVALHAEASNQGLGNALDIPLAFWVPVSVVLLDFAIYWQHVIFHKVPFLWRLHSVHHADKDYDVTTGSRFHPIEILLSMIIKITLIWTFGIPAISVLIFEVILNGMAMFNHSNIGLPIKLETLVRALLVTPDMHRVHHSVERRETDSNFGFNLSIWDRVFGTYRPHPDAGQQGMTIGLPGELSKSQTNTLKGMLILPFRKL